MRWVRRVKKGIWGEQLTFKGLLKSHLEKYYCRSFSKYMKWEELKWSHYIMREENALTRYLMPPNKTSNARNGLYLVESLSKGCSMDPLPKHHRLLSRLWATIHNLMVRLYCWRHNLHILSNELSWANSKLEFSPLLTSTHGGCDILYTLPEEQGNHQFLPTTNSLTYNRELPRRYSGVIVAQMLWE